MWLGRSGLQWHALPGRGLGQLRCLAARQALARRFRRPLLQGRSTPSARLTCRGCRPPRRRCLWCPALVAFCEAFWQGREREARAGCQGPERPRRPREPLRQRCRDKDRAPGWTLGALGPLNG